MTPKDRLSELVSDFNALNQGGGDSWENLSAMVNTFGQIQSYASDCGCPGCEEWLDGASPVEELLNVQRKEELRARVEALTGNPYVAALTASGVDVTRLEHFDAQAETFATRNGKRASETLSDSYAEVLRRFEAPGVSPTQGEWTQAMTDALRPQLEEHLRTVATNSWAGRGLPLPSPDAREAYVKLAARRALTGLSDIRKRYEAATEGAPGRQSPAEYLQRAGQTAASIADRATDYLYESYEKSAFEKGAIVEKVWRNSNPLKSRHGYMEGLRARPTERHIDPRDGKPIWPRQPRGGQKEFSSSNAVIRYILKNGKEV